MAQEIPEELKESLRKVAEGKSANADIFRAESDLQTLAALGAEWEINGIKVPQPSLCAIVLLDTVNSPFVSGDNEAKFGLRETLEALYIIKERRKIKDLLVSPKLYESRMAKAREMASKSPEHYREYLNAIERHSCKDEYAKGLLEFTESLGSMKIDGLAMEIISYINLCLSPADMLPKNGNAEKKKIRPELDDPYKSVPFKQD